MSRTNNPSVSVYNYIVTSYTNTGGTGNITFNIALSTETSSNLVGYLSGNPTVATPSLSAVLAPTALSGLSATFNNSIAFTWPSILGGSVFYGFVSNSTVAPGTSAFTLGIEFNGLDMYTNTLLLLSGTTNSASVVVYNTSTIDNPFYDANSSFTDVNRTNDTIVTVGEHLRRWNLNG